MKTKITVGIPAYKRPKTLNRALHSLRYNISKEKLKIKIVVSVDGIDEHYLDYKKLEKKYNRENYIEFIFQKKNLGSINNFMFLRDICKTKYFMWLADDDEINFATIKEMYNRLSKSDAISIVPYWELVKSKTKRKIIKPTFFNYNNLLKRIIKYLIDSDDVFFYGLHKVYFLKKCEFTDYFWPNKSILTNWSYIFLFDLIIQGKIIFLDNKKFKWTNHDYGKKFYIKSTDKKFFKHFAYFLRRLNIFYFYIKKLFKWRIYKIFIILIPILLFYFIRDTFFIRPIYKRINF